MLKEVVAELLCRVWLLHELEVSSKRLLLGTLEANFVQTLTRWDVTLRISQDWGFKSHASKDFSQKLTIMIYFYKLSVINVCTHQIKDAVCDLTSGVLYLSM